MQYLHLDVSQISRPFFNPLFDNEKSKIDFDYVQSKQKHDLFYSKQKQNLFSLSTFHKKSKAKPHGSKTNNFQTSLPACSTSKTALYDRPDCVKIFEQFHTAKQKHQSWFTLATDLSKITGFTVTRHQARYQMEAYKKRIASKNSDNKVQTKINFAAPIISVTKGKESVPQKISEDEKSKKNRDKFLKEMKNLKAAAVGLYQLFNKSYSNVKNFMKKEKNAENVSLSSSSTSEMDDLKKISKSSSKDSIESDEKSNMLDKIKNIHDNKNASICSSDSFITYPFTEETTVSIETSSDSGKFVKL